MGLIRSTPSISIHALVKRATGLCLWETLANVDFNPRPREEGDAVSVSTSSPLGYFNPRPREEGDQSALDGGLCLWISIHALVKRATCGGCIGRRFLRHFNPRPREEGDHFQSYNHCKIPPFQSTPS